VVDSGVAPFELLFFAVTLCRNRNPDLYHGLLGLLLKLDEMNLPHFGKSRPTDNLEAFDDYLRGVESWSLGTKADYDKDRQWLEKAIAHDPEYAEAYADLGWLHLLAAWNQWSANPLADLKQATELAQKALVLDDTNSTALALLSSSDWMQGRYDQAVADGERAVAINPNYAQGYQALADALDVAGKPKDAVPAAQKAMRLDPTHADFFGYDLGVSYVGMGRYEAAIPILERHLAAYPNGPAQLVAHLGLIVAYSELGRDKDARAEAAEIMRMSSGFTLASLPRTKDAAWDKRLRDDSRKAGLK